MLRMQEKEFQKSVVDLATFTGWLVYHNPDSRRSTAGFPDLVLLKDRLLFRELKTTTGRVSEAQKYWLTALTWVGQDAKVWRPADWPEIEATLKGEVIDGDN